MAEWRERGYVPDSDDEESDVEGRGNGLSGNEDERHDRDNSRRSDTEADLHQTAAPQSLPAKSTSNSSGTQQALAPLTAGRDATPSRVGHADKDQNDLVEPAPPTSANERTSTAEKLEAELAKGLETCQQVLGNRPATPGLGDTDSPLSSLPSSPGGSLPETEAPEPAKENSSNQGVSVFHDAERSVMPAFSTQMAVAARSLRPRALMQLRPFTVEYAKYQQDWKARGLPPIRPTPGHVSHDTRLQEETQDTDVFTSSQNFASSSRPSSPPSGLMLVENNESQSPLQPIRPTQPPLVAFEDDLPDLADILNGHAQLSVVIPSMKKRKADQEGQKHSRRKRPRQFNPLADVAREREWDRVRDAVHNMPLSPPRSVSMSSSLPPVAEEDVGDPRMATPRLLPTPVLSSDRQVTKQAIVEVFSSSNADTESEKAISSSSGSDSGNEEPQGLVQMRRRIKGVLPASWVRLDAHQRKQPGGPRRVNASPEKFGTVKGIARPVLSSRLSFDHQGRRLLPLDLESDEEDTDSASDSLQSPTARSAEAGRNIMNQYDDSIFVDVVGDEDEVDAMLHRASRASRQEHRPAKKRQQRLGYAWNGDGIPVRQRPQRREHYEPSRTSRDTHSKPTLRRRRRKDKAQQLTVLDAPGFTRDQDEDMPRFLKVAARVGKSPRGRIPQNPKQKFFQLSTRDDTADVHKGLQEWKSGASRKSISKSHGTTLTRLRQNSHASQRAQLPPDLRHNVQTNAESTAQIQKLKIASNRTLSRLQHQSSTIITSALNSTDAVSAKALRGPRHLGVFFSHVNRSGAGSLLNPTNARAAQLEAPRVSLQPQRRMVRRSQAPQAVTKSSSPPAFSSRLQPISLFRLKKRPPKISAITSPITSHPAVSSTSAASDLDDMADHFRHWFGSLDSSKVTAHLNTLIAPNSSLFTTSHYIYSGSFGQVLTGLHLRRTQLERGEFAVAGSLNSTSEISNELAGLFAQIEKIIPSEESANPHLPLSQDMINGIFYHVEAAQKLLAGNAWFANVPATARMRPAVFDNLQDAVMRVKIFHSWAQVSDKSVAIFILNQLAVCAYQVADITIEADDVELRQRSFEFVETAAADAVSTVLTTKAMAWPRDPIWAYEGNPRPPCFINARNQAEFVWQYRGVFDPLNTTYANETLVIIYALIERQRLPGSTSSFDTVLQQACYSTVPGGPAAQLAGVIGFVRLIHPLTRLGPIGILFDRGFNCFQVLLPAIDAFLASTLDGNKTATTPSREEHQCIIANMFRHCNGFITEWHWDPDQFLTSLLRIYARNNMNHFVPSDIYRHTLFRHAQEDLALQGGESDFEAFLKLVATVLRGRSKELGTLRQGRHDAVTKKLSNLVFGLLPNNTQFFDRKKNIKATDHLALWNHYELCLTLYVHCPEEHRPALRLFEHLLDFKSSPRLIRGLTIDMWTALSQHAVTCSVKSDDTKYLAEWAIRMLRCVSEDLGILNDLDARDRRGYVAVLNTRKDLSISMAHLLRQWKVVAIQTLPALVASMIPREAMLELTNALTVVTTHLSQTAVLSHEAATHTRSTQEPSIYDPYTTVMEFLSKLAAIPALYADEVRSIADDLAKSTMSTILSHDFGYESHSPNGLHEVARKVLTAVTEQWCIIASLNVGLHKSWDEYLTAPSSLSFDILADTEQSRQCKILFMARMIRNNPMNFTMDKLSFYAAWIGRIVLPEHLMAFENSLCTQIHRFDPPGGLIGPVMDNITPNARVTVPGLKQLQQNRLEIIGGLIARIYALQLQPTTADDSQGSSMEESLDSEDLADLLKLMTNTMKASWRALTQQRRPAYLEFIRKVLVQLQSYDFLGFQIDKWFTDPQEPELPKADGSFGDHFKLAVGGVAKPLSKSMVRAFRESLIGALGSHKEQAWIAETAAALSCGSYAERAPELSGNAAAQLLTDGNQLLIDARLQLQFVRVVIPVYIEQCSDVPGAAPLASAVARVLITISNNAYTRVEEAGDGEELAGMARSILHVVEREETCRVQLSEEETELQKWAKGDLMRALEGENGRKGVVGETDGADEVTEVVAGEGTDEVEDAMATLFV